MIFETNLRGSLERLARIAAIGCLHDPDPLVAGGNCKAEGNMQQAVRPTLPLPARK